MRTTSLLLICLFTMIYTSAQTVIISGVEGNRKLQWSDFTGRPDNSASFIAYTWYNVKAKPKMRLSGDSLVIYDAAVVLELDPVKSWAKQDKVTDELLKHEQGHFDIGRLCMNEIRQELMKTKFGVSDFSSKLSSLVSGIIAKYKTMSSKYDEETSHSKNKQQQLHWDQFFSARLPSTESEN